MEKICVLQPSIKEEVIRKDQTFFEVAGEGILTMLVYFCQRGGIENRRDPDRTG